MVSAVKTKNTLISRPPVVVVVGHVDHGKTKLLDYIRKTNVIGKESGGITQHIGAYEIEHNGRKVTFIDTPGHEAFSNIRSRGVKAADIAILVVATEEGVKPQTKEAIEHIKSANIPVIVALNKIDKPEANPEKVKGELMKAGVIVESQGGDVPAVAISAKEGTGVEELLEIVNLVADLNDLKGDPTLPGTGVILESHLDSRRGPTATLLVTNGTVKRSDWLWIGTTYGKVKILEDFKGSPIEEVAPSQPAVVSGLSSVSKVGEVFYAVGSEAEAMTKAKEETEVRAKGVQEKIEEPAEEGAEATRFYPIILKADVLSSLEAIDAELSKINTNEVSVKVLTKEPGDVNENDVRRAASSGATIFAFRVKTGSTIQNLIRQEKVEVVTTDVIYDLVTGIKERASRLLNPAVTRKDLGKVKILAVFKKDGSRLIIGGKVTQGELLRGGNVDVKRAGEYMGSGKIIQLQRQKKDVDKVPQGEECGMAFEGNCEVKTGDVLEYYEEEKHKRSL